MIRLTSGARLVAACAVIALAATGCENEEQQKQAILKKSAERRAQLAEEKKARLETLTPDCSSSGSIFLAAKADLVRKEPLLAETQIAKCEEVLGVDPATAKLKAAIVAAAETRRVSDAKQRELAERKQAAAEKAHRKRSGVSVGMSKQQVLESMWGRPEKINETTTAAGTREQWVYPGYQYLYFSNGVLTTIQSRGDR